MISQLPKGAVADPKDERDLKAEPMLGALPPVDWSKGSGLPRPPLKDQDQSDSCVAHAFSYYHWQLKGKDFSRRDLFARIAQAYGSSLRDAGLAIVKQGQATTDEVSDPVPETPANMRDKTGITLAEEMHDQEMNSFILPGNIDAVASAINAYKGVVFGLYGTNTGWQNMTVPEPPTGAVPMDMQSRPDIWGHGLYAADFHIHSDGQKCIIAVTSWPNAGITEHHIREHYFLTSWTFNPWTLIPKEQQIMTVKFKVNQNGKLGIMILEGFTGSILFADTQAHFTELCDANGITDATPTIQIPQQ